MKRVVVHRASSFKDAAEFDRRFWKRVGVAGRFAAQWSTVGDYLKLRGKRGDQPRLRRSIQNIEHL